MKVALIDADLMDNGTRHPNLALMKLAGYHLELGDEVDLLFETYDDIKGFDKIYISKVFNFTKIPNWVLNEKNVVIGGTGFFEDGGQNLPYEIEHHKPYYNLYLKYVNSEVLKGKKKSNYNDYLDYSIGFTTRGCFRKCSFCVNKKYDFVFKHSKVTEFLDNNRKAIYLWDDNILAYPDWELVINELEETNKSFQFRQGIDLRLMDERKAYRFNNIKYHGDFIFAFDHLKDKDLIIKNVQLWKRYTNKNPKMYVLSGYESQDLIDIESVFERISILMKYGSLPYIMRYEKYKESKFKNMYIQIARWCNQPRFFKKQSFREFCFANQQYQINSGNADDICLSYKTMLDFQLEFPDVANKYFDLKFETENIYNNNFGLGKKYINKQNCEICQIKKHDWISLVNENRKNEILDLYFSKEIDFNCLNYSNSTCKIDVEIYSKKVIDLIHSTDTNSLLEFINNSEFNKTRDLNDYVIDFLEIDEIIDIINRIDKNKKMILLNKNVNIFVIKNKDKFIFLSSLDLINLKKVNHEFIVTLSAIGNQVVSLKEDFKRDVIKKLFFRNSFIQDIVIRKHKFGDIEKSFFSKVNSEKLKKNYNRIIKMHESGIF